MNTKLDNILSVTKQELPLERVSDILARIGETLENRKAEVLVQVMPRYNQELSRILYALCCFDKEVQFDAQTDTYTVKVCVMGNEKEFLLSKLRFLRKRVRVLEGEYVKRRMLEASVKALERYGVVEEVTDKNEEALDPAQ
ncbi:outer membrane protein assembly factor BamA [Paenibacillus rhizosphaerae]|uniref:Outer membrane protein assembly factor BamA n=1 Tax=Paenibacillus rhizosphaerae TaxID=297318 RepID=A0A839TW89_9BACL|nr:hypothetical protein [Paenibacillus rhizosphaerae]MBB3129860.1 outer membrane protein assembly factor BamA [Paenibacillus rhizosphaerae]